MNTHTWAHSLGIPCEPDLAPVPAYLEPCARSAAEIAVRAIILQGVVAVAFRVDPNPIVDWFKVQGIWQHVTRQERAFIEQRMPAPAQRDTFCWHKEAEWALLWAIGKVETLGLPTSECDIHQLINETIPPLGSDIRQFVSSAVLRSSGALLAEDDRTYNLWCHALAARKRNEALPDDLNLQVLYERRYAFEWLDGAQDWDEVTCDA